MWNLIKNFFRNFFKNLFNNNDKNNSSTSKVNLNDLPDNTIIVRILDVPGGRIKVTIDKYGNGDAEIIEGNPDPAWLMIGPLYMARQVTFDDDDDF